MNDKKVCKRVCKKGEFATERFTFAICFISVFLPFKNNFEFGLDFSASLVGPAKTYKYLYKTFTCISVACVQSLARLAPVQHRSNTGPFLSHFNLRFAVNAPLGELVPISKCRSAFT